MENITHASILSLIDEYRNLFSMLSIMFVFALHMFPWREKKHLRIILAALMLVVFGFLSLWPANGMRVLTDMTSFYIAIAGWYVFAIAVAIALIAFLFKAGIAELIWLLLTSYAAHHLVYVLVSEILFSGLLKEYYSYYRMLCVYIPVAFLIYLLVYRLFRPILMDSVFLSSEQTSRFYVIVICIFLMIFVVSSFINMHNALAGEEFNYLAAISDFSNCLFVIVAQYAYTLHRKSDYDRTVVEVILRNEKSQYEAYRRSVDYVNIKAHDLRHQIQAMQHPGEAEKLQEISRELDHYASFLQTGNDTLDIILSDKVTNCQALGIDLICMADAHRLSCMEESDMYSFFGNIIENAIEYVQGIEDPEYRYIRLMIKPAPGGTLIQEENHLIEDLILVDGLPETTKNDTRYHGFGMKSIRFIAEKYGGQLMISAEDRVFSLSCLIPGAE